MHPFQIPEHAIISFEQAHQLHVTVHDLNGRLSPFLNSNRGHHCSPLCLAVKAQGRQEACHNFDVARLRPKLAELTEGRIHICHAGLVEWVVPIFQSERLAWILFAGPRRPGRSLVSALAEGKTLPPAGRRLPVPAPVDEKEAQKILEHLRQLAARLHVWAARHHPDRAASGGDVTVIRSLPSRAQTIRRFLEQNYEKPATSLERLAAWLGLSPSRTSHVVRATCGASFRELLIRRRLQSATDLLSHTGLSVQQVAAGSGFEEIAHFHRLFRRRIGTTPAAYRIKGRA